MRVCVCCEWICIEYLYSYIYKLSINWIELTNLLCTLCNCKAFELSKGYTVSARACACIHMCVYNQQTHAHNYTATKVHRLIDVTRRRRSCPSTWVCIWMAMCGRPISATPLSSKKVINNNNLIVKKYWMNSNNNKENNINIIYLLQLLQTFSHNRINKFVTVKVSPVQQYIFKQLGQQ